MIWWFVLAGGFYLVGFAFTMVIHTQMPVTFGLAMLRSAAWPIWMTTGWPSGQHLPMD